MERTVKLEQQSLFLVVTLGAAVSTPLQAQVLSPTAVTPVVRNAPSIPDFSGIWAHPSLGFENPLSGPGPVRNLTRTRSGASNNGALVGDYTNPILKPQAAQIVKERGEISLSGRAFPDPDSMCILQPVPYIFWNFEIQILQQANKVTILYPHDQDYRFVRLNQPHPSKVTPTAHGDAIGHYEGADTLVIDTVGVKVGKYTMIDRLGTPYTEALHAVERYRLLDYEVAKEAQERGFKEWPRVGGGVDPNYKGKGVQLDFTVEDEGAFTMPWRATITYLRSANTRWQERICAENVQQYNGTSFYSDKDARIPTADKPDF
jgi:hypothetical protein